MPGRTVLIVEDDETVAAGLTRILRRMMSAQTLVAPTLDVARKILKKDPRVSAIILDIHLPDGSGLELLEEMSTRAPSIPTMVLTGEWSAKAMRVAQSNGALFLPKPASIDSLRAFVRWALGNDAARASLHREVMTFADELHLSRREADVVRCAASGVSRGEIGDHLGVAETTLRTLVRRILKKSDKASLGEVVATVHGRLFGPEESGVVRAVTKQSGKRPRVGKSHAHEGDEGEREVS